MYYEERTTLPSDPDRTFRFALSTEAEFIAGNVLLRVVEESARGNARKLIIRIPEEDAARSVMRAAGGALVVHDLVTCGAWAALAKPIPPGGPIPVADLPALRPYLSQLPYPNL